MLHIYFFIYEILSKPFVLLYFNEGIRITTTFLLNILYVLKDL